MPHVDILAALHGALPPATLPRWGAVRSVVLDGGELGVQVHRDVLVEGADGGVGAVAEVVEAVQLLPLPGVPQQFVSANTIEGKHKQHFQNRWGGSG